ncbi:MAG: dihydroorotate dehydrogenase electron transfer subunit [Dehalococcoidia bacterium]|nr:dihydroorotate dehydrogenase electron transfer subunit [Dehalococcoidia bacterium]
MKQALSCIISNDEILPNIYLMWVESPELAATAKPGQFLMIQCPNLLLRRPLSIHRTTKRNRIALLYTIKGPGTKTLSQLSAGNIINLLGPLGNGFSINSSSSTLLLLAGGMGIAPLIFLADVALKQKLSVTILIGASTANKIYPKNLIPEQIHLSIFTEDDSKVGKKGLITDDLSQFVRHADQIFACGPIGMYHSLSHLTKEMNLKNPVQISLEIRMGCGVGSCLSCSIPTKNGQVRVCKEGPVFELQEILLDKVKI